MTQPVSSYLLYTETRALSQVSQSAICGGHSGTKTGLYPTASVQPLSIIPPTLLNRIHLNTVTIMGHDSSVGTATRYGLDGPGIESRWGLNFPHPSRQALGHTQPPVQWVPGLSRG